MPYFKELIQTEKGLLTFYFNRIFTVSGIKYHVSARAGKLTHYFMMEDGGGVWGFTDATALSDWIIELRPKLEDAIKKHLNEDATK
jgi:hypothetical protein